MADDGEQLDIWTVSVPVPLPPVPALPTGARERRRGDRGGAVEAAKIPDRPEKYIDVLQVIASWSKADFEIQAALPDVHPGTICKRRLRLEQAKLIEEVPGVMRATPHGVDAMTFRITPTGKEVLAQWRQQASQPSSGKNPPATDREPTPISSMPFGPLPASGPCSAETSGTPVASSPT